MSFFTVKHLALKLAATAALVAHTGIANAAPKEAGIWYDDTGKGAVKIEACGNKLCGRIYWLKDLLNAEGKPLRDKYNPNEGQRNRPICGLQVIGGLTLMESGEWDSGWIYDPKEGKSYSVAITMADANTLKVTGYLVMKMMGRTLTWTRAPNDLPPCAGNAAGAAPGAAPAAKASKVGAAAPAEEKQVAPPAAPAPSAAAEAPAAQTAPDVPPAQAEKPKAEIKPKAKAAAKPADPAAPPSAKSTAKAPAAKPTVKAQAEVLPWSKDKKAAATAPAAGSAAPAPANPAAVPEAPAAKPVRQAAPDMQATFGAQ